MKKRDRKKPLPHAIALASLFMMVLSSSFFAGNLVAKIQGQGVYIDITLQDVAVPSFEVKRGEKVTFTVTLRNRGEVTEDYITLRLYSGERLLTEKAIFPDRWDVKDMAKFDFVWDTSDVTPGSYPVVVEAFMFSDQDPWDNRYELPQEMVIR